MIRIISIIISLMAITLLFAQVSKTELKTIEELKALQQSAGEGKLWGNPNIPPLVKAKGRVIYKDCFENLDNWHHEGRGDLSQPEANVMQLNCVGAAQGGIGCMAFCRQDFPDSICIEFDLKVLTTNGLIITFVAAQGRHGEDIITELPKRKGVFADYVYNPNLRCYHASVSRYNDQGVHTGTSNWRRNPGLFLMAQQPDLCKEPNRWYHITIVKQGNLLQMAVDGHLAGGFIDLHEIPGAIPTSGKVGFRAIGAEVIAQIKNFRITEIDGSAKLQRIKE